MMDSDSYFGNRQKRKTLDSPTDDFVDLDVNMDPVDDPEFLENKNKTNMNVTFNESDVVFDPNVQDTARVETSVPEEYYYKMGNTNTKSQSTLSQQFLSNFLLEFTDDELAAKRTVETIYSASSSFAYTYRSLDEAFFSRTNNFNTLMPFVKAMVSVADESMLLKEIENKNNVDRLMAEQETTSPLDKSLLINFELVMLGYFRPIKAKLNDFMSLQYPLSWRELSEFITILFKNGIMTDFYTFFSNVYGIYEIFLEDFKRYFLDLRLYLTRLHDFLTLEEKKLKKPKTTDVYSLSDCIDIVNFLSKSLDTLRKILVLFLKNITNTPQTDNLEKVLVLVESDLSNQGYIRLDEGEVSDKVSCIRMLLDEDTHKFLGNPNSVNEVGVCRDKFNGFYTAYQEDLQRKSDQSSEFQKKKKFKRDSVQYVLDRLDEQSSNKLPTNCKNPFYTVGLAPKLCTQATLKKYSRKLKTLLHPDTEHDTEWKHKAEKAFKEASLSLDQCLNLIDTLAATFFRVGPVPPYLTHIGVEYRDDAGYVQGNSGFQDNFSTYGTSTFRPFSKGTFDNMHFTSASNIYNSNNTQNNKQGGIFGSGGSSFTTSGSFTSASNFGSNIFSTGNNNKDNNTSTNNNNNNNNNVNNQEPTFLYFPSFKIRCEDKKVGSLSVELDLTTLSESKIWQSMGKNKFVNMFVLRPLHTEPLTMQVPHDKLSSVNKFPLTDTVKNKTPIYKVDAVQPIELGTSWKYFVGISISGDKGSTLVNWNSVFIELPSKGRTIGHIIKLLKTFVNASFIHQGELQEKLKTLKVTNSKSEGEKFLLECVKNAQKWALEN